MRFLRPYTGRFGFSMFLGIVGSVLEGSIFLMLIPFLRAVFGESILSQAGGKAEQLLNRVLGPLLQSASQERAFAIVVALILVTVMLKNLCVYFSRLYGLGAQELIVCDMRAALYAHLQGMRLDYFQRTRGGQLLTRMLADTEQVKPMLGDWLAELVRSSATTMVYLAILFALSWRLTVLALVLVPVLVFALRPLLKKLRRRASLLLDDRGELTSLMQETVSGVRLVKAYCAEPYEKRRFHEAAIRYARGVIRWERLALASQPISETFGALVTVVLLWVGVRMTGATGATLEPSGFIAFLFVALRLMAPLKFISNFPAQAQGPLAAGERILDVLREPPLEAGAPGSEVVCGFTQSLEFREVSFAYPGGPPVVNGVSFTTTRGDIVALVGPSGAGKSTLVDLIPRFYDPVAGAILLDRRDVRNFTLGSLRALMGIVSQETALFNDTARANIAYGAEGQYSDAQIEAAARAANAHAFISALPDGYATLLGERGTRLSGGERQRLAIARALLRDPPILILDEATSALDTESERLVQEAIDRSFEGRTVFVIAHRLSTVQHATQILVLENGRIVQRGGHEELLASSGLYRRLYELQFGADPQSPVMV
jgi:subfamily B ATP-binding cassette protein MsbA